MLRNGTDLGAALSILECQDFDASIRAMTTKMIEQAAIGATTEEVIADQGGAFPPVVRFALLSGRAGGRTPETLVALADALAQAADLGMTLEIVVPNATDEAERASGQAPIVRLVNKILWDAGQQEASEIHVHASEGRNTTCVDLCIGGEWSELTQLPGDVLGPICRRLCIMAGINWVLKQPALGTLRVGERDTDVRGAVQFLPGESEAEYQVRVTLGGRGARGEE
jgi:type II secretory ATPase GspE/PulE/Tfp pilus assembly ATPase PilB-like protein